MIAALQNYNLKYNRQPPRNPEPSATPRAATIARRVRKDHPGPSVDRRTITKIGDGSGKSSWDQVRRKG
ncbi:hypothetical protein XFLAVUS301_35640 [Xanthobacter flavus]|uniref:Uncharacterized protein n=1 Tax=Xanthobacter flavus TaxID=281 RepID=A0A9W6CP02_XANFL|nr:hypothetical protein XFLAVUS301_35640 [Xanthobacter flavus]